MLLLLRYDAPDGSATVRKTWDSIFGNFIFANYHSSMAVDNDDGRCVRACVYVCVCARVCMCVFVMALTRSCSAYFDTHHNVLVYKAIDAAWGGASLKSDFGGHSNRHHHNIDLFFSRGFSICTQLQASARAVTRALFVSASISRVWLRASRISTTGALLLCCALHHLHLSSRSNLLYMTQDGVYGDGETCSGAGETVVFNNTIYSPTGNVMVRARVHVMAIVDCRTPRACAGMGGHSSRLFLHKRILVLCLS
jgi:hypothetical protein